MARFDVFALTDGPLVVDCQSDLLGHLNSRFVIPLLPPDVVADIAPRLNPEFVIDGALLRLFPQGAASVASGELVATPYSLEAEGMAILAAIDVLVSGI